MSNVVNLNGGQDAAQELVDAWARIEKLEQELNEREVLEERLTAFKAVARDFVRLIADIDDLFSVRHLPFSTRLRIEALCEQLGTGRLWR